MEVQQSHLFVSATDGTLAFFALAWKTTKHLYLNSWLDYESVWGVEQYGNDEYDLFLLRFAEEAFPCTHRSVQDATYLPIPLPRPTPHLLVLSTLVPQKGGQPPATSDVSFPDKRKTFAATTGFPRGRQEGQAPERDRRCGAEKEPVAGRVSQLEGLVVPFFGVEGKQRQQQQQQQGALRERDDSGPCSTVVFLVGRVADLTRVLYLLEA